MRTGIKRTIKQQEELTNNLSYNNTYTKTRFEFEIILVTGEKALCTLPRVSGKVEVGIECILQEELKNEKIMIQQGLILDGYIL